jgi:hypothetical protein
LEDYLGLNHADKSGKARNIARGIRFWVVKDVQEPSELFAEEIPREDSEAGDQENLTNVFSLTRDVARTHGIAFKFVSLKLLWDESAGLTKERGFPLGFRPNPLEVWNTARGDRNARSCNNPRIILIATEPVGNFTRTRGCHGGLRH